MKTEWQHLEDSNDYLRAEKKRLIRERDELASLAGKALREIIAMTARELPITSEQRCGNCKWWEPWQQYVANRIGRCGFGPVPLSIVSNSTTRETEGEGCPCWQPITSADDEGIDDA